MEQQLPGPIGRFLAAAIKRTGNVATALGLLLIIGFVVAGAAAWIFTELAETVQAGATLGLDDAALHWMAAHQSPIATTVALEVTALGTATVVILMTLVAGMFLALNDRRVSAILLIAATVGGMALNLLLKLHYHRPRPHIFPWETHVVSSSFPSGHAMNAIIVYGTIAYIAASLTRRTSIRAVTQILAATVIIAICASRVYLGVHYPSDVVGGFIIGMAWAVFCVTAFGAFQRIRLQRNNPNNRSETTDRPL